MTELHLQTHIDGAWRDAAVLTIADDDAGHLSASKLEYEVDYWAHNTTDDEVPLDDRALSIGAPLQFADHRFATWPPFLLDLLPQGDARTVLSRELGFNPENDAVELPLLLRAAGSPIGNVRVLEAHQRERQSNTNDEVVPLSLIDVVKKGEPFSDIARRYALLASGSSGIQGVWPKLMLTSRADGMLLPDSVLPDDEACQHFIIKTVTPRPDNHDVHILASEPGYIEVARTCGVRCGGHLVPLTDSMLQIPRFDREVTAAGVVRHGQESIVAAAGIAEFAYSGHHETYLDVLKRACTHPEVEVIEYLRRDMLAIAMGDVDNHGRNTALRKRRNRIELSPLFDFAPMRLKQDTMRSTRWKCAPKPVPDAAGILAICSVVADGTRLSAEQVLAELRAMAPMLRGLKDMARAELVPYLAIERAIIDSDALARSIEAV